VVSERERGETFCTVGTKEKHRKFEGYDFSRCLFGCMIWSLKLPIWNLEVQIPLFEWPWNSSLETGQNSKPNPSCVISASHISKLPRSELAGISLSVRHRRLCWRCISQCLFFFLSQSLFSLEHSLTHTHSQGKTRNGFAKELPWFSPWLHLSSLLIQ
jgi:hypothetical protein